jgi:hypothetical protein
MTLVYMHTITIYFVVCESGAFVYNCASNCHCTNQPCDGEHGTCPAGGCQRGYEGIIIVFDFRKGRGNGMSVHNLRT